jgi:hypothetical protein
MEEVGMVYGHSVYFMAYWYNLWSFGILFQYLVYFSRFGMLHQEKSGNTGNHYICSCAKFANPFEFSYIDLTVLKPVHTGRAYCINRCIML